VSAGNARADRPEQGVFMVTECTAKKPFSSENAERDPLKFLNGDDCLNDIIEDMKASGTFPSIPNKEDFYRAVLDTDWSDDDK
jgi:hypothetical protein